MLGKMYRLVTFIQPIEKMIRGMGPQRLEAHLGVQLENKEIRLKLQIKSRGLKLSLLMS